MPCFFPGDLTCLPRHRETWPTPSPQGSNRTSADPQEDRCIRSYGAKGAQKGVTLLALTLFLCFVGMRHINVEATRWCMPVLCRSGFRLRNLWQAEGMAADQRGSPYRILSWPASVLSDLVVQHSDTVGFFTLTVVHHCCRAPRPDHATCGSSRDTKYRISEQQHEWTTLSLHRLPGSHGAFRRKLSPLSPRGECVGCPRPGARGFTQAHILPLPPSRNWNPNGSHFLTTRCVQPGIGV